MRNAIWIVVVASTLAAASAAPQKPPKGFVSLFNGRDLSGWKVPDGDNGHWKVLDGVIDYDARSEAPKDKHLWTLKEYRNFVLRIDWRIKATPYRNNDVRVLLPNGSEKRDENGDVIRIEVPDSDSGIFLRGTAKAQVNIWCWPSGSGEMYGYRTDPKMPAAVRASVTPRLHADKNIGQWNTFEITVQGDTVSVILNGKSIIEGAQLPALPESGRLALQHHGEFQDGQWTVPPSLVQFRNIFIKVLPETKAPAGAAPGRH